MPATSASMLHTQNCEKTKNTQYYEGAARVYLDWSVNTLGLSENTL